MTVRGEQQLPACEVPIFFVLQPGLMPIKHEYGSKEEAAAAKADLMQSSNCFNTHTLPLFLGDQHCSHRNGSTTIDSGR